MNSVELITSYIAIFYLVIHVTAIFIDLLACQCQFPDCPFVLFLKHYPILEKSRRLLAVFNNIFEKENETITKRNHLYLISLSVQLSFFSWALFQSGDYCNNLFLQSG